MAGTISKPARTSPLLRVSYPQVFVPKTFAAGDVPRYSIVLMIDKTNKEQMEFMKQLHQDASKALVEKWPDESTRPRIPLTGHDNSLFKDGDAACNKQGIPLREKNEEYIGHYIIRAGTTTKPMLVNKGRQEILDTNEIYGGCYCKVNVNIYTFERPENKGVTCGLNGLQKMDDGESFGGGRPSVDTMFTAEGGADDSANYDPFATGEATSEKDYDDIPL